jgi:hypothetical protein
VFLKSQNVSLYNNIEGFEHPEFLNTPREIANNPRYMPHFKLMISFVFIDDALN